MDVEKIKHRFYAKVNKTSTCWLWTAYVDKVDGYGQIRIDGKSMRTHRVAWWLRYGEWPELLRHTCDNPRCVNTNHLVVGTHALNVQDRVSRGRSAKGDKHGRSKLNEQIVAEVRKSKETNAALARKHCVDPKAIARARLGLTWKHVTS